MKGLRNHLLTLSWHIKIEPSFEIMKGNPTFLITYLKSTYKKSQIGEKIQVHIENVKA